MLWVFFVYSYKFEFPTPDDRPGPPIISFSDASFDTRIAMVGPNGVGKSTILKLISGELQPSMGTVFRSAKVRIAVFIGSAFAAPTKTIFGASCEAQKHV
nr:abc transporter f family member 3 [Quercus suber]